MYLRAKILLLFLFVGLSLKGQSFMYNYIDPCTKEIKTIYADMSSPIMVSYYGQVKSFTYQQLQDGTFDSWMNQTYVNYKGVNPCQGLVTTTTTTTSTNLVSNTINLVMNLNTVTNLDFSGIGRGVGTDVAGNTSSGSGSVKNDKKKEDKDKNKDKEVQVNGQGTQSSGTDQNNNQNSTPTSQEKSGSQTSGSPGSGSSGTPNSSSGSPANPPGSNPGSSGDGSPGSTSPSTGNGSGTSGGSGTNPPQSGGTNPPSGGDQGSGSSTTGSSGSSTGSAGGTTGSSGSPQPGGGSGTKPPGDKKDQVPQEKIDQTKEDQQKAMAGSTSRAADKAKTNVQKPAILVTGDIVGVQSASVSRDQDARGTFSFTRVKGDGTASLSVSADYMINAKIGNVTLVRSWIGKNAKGNKHINVLSDGISLMPGTLSNTLLFVRVNSLKNFTALYGAAGSYGRMYKEELISTIAIGGFMYKGKLTKKIDATVIAAGIYSPYTKYYTESIFESRPFVIPFLNLNYKMTKTFGFGLTGGGTYIAGQNVLNYQVLLGAKLIL